MPAALHGLRVGAWHPNYPIDTSCHGVPCRVAVTVDGAYGNGARGVESRRRNLLVFVNPVGGAGNALATYNDVVAPVLRHAQVDVELVGACLETCDREP